MPTTKEQTNITPEEFSQVWERVQESNGGTSMIQPVRPAETLCLGEGSRCHQAFLQEQITAALIDRRTFGLLAGYGPGGQVLRSLAGEKLRQARRLSTACFLITGERFFPSDSVVPLRCHSWQEGMRVMFHRSQRQSESYLRAAEETRDACLRELFQSIARENSLHALRIRAVLEMW